jgi:hypothetical protein
VYVHVVYSSQQGSMLQGATAFAWPLMHVRVEVLWLSSLNTPLPPPLGGPSRVPQTQLISSATTLLPLAPGVCSSP